MNMNLKISSHTNIYSHLNPIFSTFYTDFTFRSLASYYTSSNRGESAVRVLYRCPSVRVLYRCPSVRVLYRCPSVRVLYRCLSVRVLYRCPSVRVLYRCPSVRMFCVYIPSHSPLHSSHRPQRLLLSSILSAKLST